MEVVVAPIHISRTGHITVKYDRIFNLSANVGTRVSENRLFIYSFYKVEKDCMKRLFVLLLEPGIYSSYPFNTSNNSRDTSKLMGIFTQMILFWL